MRRSWFLLLIGPGALQVLLELVESFRPDLSIPRYPVSSGFQRCRFEMTGPVLRVPTPRDQSSRLEHLEVLGHRLQAHVKGLGELVHRRFTFGQADQDGASGRIG